MLRLLGISYLTDGIFAAVAARRKEESYRVYVTDCLRILCAGFGAKIDVRYYDMLHPDPELDKPAEELVKERLDRFGIKVVS